MYARTISSAFIAGCILSGWNAASAEPASPASPAPPAPAATLEQVQALALRNSPAGRTAGGRYWDTIADSVSLATLENPELSAATSIPFASGEERGGTEYAVRIRQTIRPSYLGLRQAVAGIIRETADRRQRSDLLALTERVRVAYTGLWSARERIAYQKRAWERLSGQLVSVREAARKGAVPKGEEHLFAAELARLEAAQLGARAQLSAAQAEIAALVGVELEPAAIERPPLGISFSLEQLLARARENELGAEQRTRLLRRLAAEQRRLAERDRGIFFTPEVGYEHDDEGTDRLALGITMPLTIFDRNRAERLRREHSLEAAEAEERFRTGPAFDAEVRSLYQAMTSLDRQETLYRERVIPLLTEALRAHEQQHRLGQGSLAQLWQTTRALLEAEEAALEITGKLARLTAEASVLIGEPL